MYKSKYLNHLFLCVGIIIPFHVGIHIQNFIFNSFCYPYPVPGTQIHYPDSPCKVVNIYGILWYYHCPPTNRERSITFLNSETLFQVSGVSARDRLASQQQGHPQEQGSLPERSRLSH